MIDRALKTIPTVLLLSFMMLLFAACPGGKGMVSGIGSSTTGAVESPQTAGPQGFDTRNEKAPFAVTASEGMELEELRNILATGISNSEKEMNIVIRPTGFDIASQAGWESRLYRFAKGSDGRLVSAEVTERGTAGTQLVARYAFEANGGEGIAIRGGKADSGSGGRMPLVASLRTAAQQARLSGSMERIVAIGEGGALEFSSPEPGQYRERYESTGGAGAIALREGAELWKGVYLLDQGASEAVRGRYVQRPSGEDEGLPMGMGAADIVTGFMKDAEGTLMFRTEGPEPFQEGVIAGLSWLHPAGKTVLLENIALVDYVLGPNNGLRPLLALPAGMTAGH